MKPSFNSLSLSLAALLSLTGIAAATDYVVQSVTLPNSTHITVLRPVEQPTTVAVYPGRNPWRSRRAPAQSSETVVQQTHSANGSQVTYLAPRP